MAEAEVGDEQRFEDPTVNALCERVAELLGFEAAVFLPSGHDVQRDRVPAAHRPGRRRGVSCTGPSHPIVAEAGGPAAFVGRVLRPLDGDARHVHARTRCARRCAPPATATCRARGSCRSSRPRTWRGGHVWPLEQLRAVVGVARERGPAAAHGRRAADERGRRERASRPPSGRAGSTRRGWTSPRASARRSAPAWPARAELIDEAWRYKQMIGGAMRQAGILAAGALYALDHHVERLADDHANARTLAAGLAGSPGVELDPASVRPTSSSSRSTTRARLVRRARGRRRADGRARPDDGPRRHAPRRRRRRSRAGRRRRPRRPRGALSGEFLGLSPTNPPLGAGASPPRRARR